MRLALQVAMCVGTLVVGVYVVLMGGGELAPFGWVVVVLGLLGIAAIGLMPGVSRSRRDRAG